MRINLTKHSKTNIPTIDDLITFTYPFNPTPPQIPLLSNKQPRLKPIDEDSYYVTQASDLNLDSHQQAAANDIANLTTCVITGVAGCGKTTVLVSGIQRALEKCPPILTKGDDWYSTNGVNPSHKYLEKYMPGMLILALSKQAVRNIAAKMPRKIRYRYNGTDFGDINLSKNCMTIHKALEYKPENSTDILSSRFVATRNSANKLPPEIKLVVIDEATLPKLGLFNELLDALPEDVAIIVAGDLYQIQAVGGISVLAASATFMKVHALSKVYRHDGEIIKLATNIRLQNTSYIEPKTVLSLGESYGKVNIITYNGDNIPAASAVSAIATYAANRIIKGLFVPGLDMHIAFHDPETNADMRNFGISSLHEEISSRLDQFYGRMTYCVRTQSKTKHNDASKILAVGDIVLADVLTTSMFMILRIRLNTDFKGKQFPPRPYKTRNPRKWVEYARKEEGDHSLEFITSSIAASLTSHDILSEGNLEIESDAKGRRASHKLLLLDVSSLVNMIADRSSNQEMSDLVTDSVLKKIAHLTMVVDAKGIKDSQIVSDALFSSSLLRLLEPWNIGNEIFDYIFEVSTSESIAKMLPYVITSHKAQGYTVRKCWLTTHNDNPGYTEMVYTSCTRPRLELTVISHPTLWGTNPNVKKSARSDVHSPQIPGITVAEKVKNIRERINSDGGYQRTTMSDINDLMYKIYGTVVQPDDSWMADI